MFVFFLFTILHLNGSGEKKKKEISPLKFHLKEWATQEKKKKKAFSIYMLMISELKFNNWEILKSVLELYKK